MIQKRVGKRIQKLRTSMGLSQEKFALKANIDRTYLASVEVGKRNISIVNLEKIVSALDMSFEDFFKEI